MVQRHEQTLRLIMPQWQGGNRHDYYFGAQVLAWLAPAPNGPVETVPVPEPQPGKHSIWRTASLAAQHWCCRHAPLAKRSRNTILIVS